VVAVVFSGVAFRGRGRGHSLEWRDSGGMDVAECATIFGSKPKPILFDLLDGAGPRRLRARGRRDVRAENVSATATRLRGEERDRPGRLIRRRIRIAGTVEAIVMRVQIYEAALKETEW